MIFLLLVLNLLFACVLHFGVSNIKNHYKVKKKKKKKKKNAWTLLIIHNR